MEPTFIALFGNRLRTGDRWVWIIVSKTFLVRAVALDTKPLSNSIIQRMSPISSPTTLDSANAPPLWPWPRHVDLETHGLSGFHR